MTWLRTFARFWYDFVVGDDWMIAVAVLAAVGLTSLLAHNGWNVWLVLPVCVCAALGGSLWRAQRTHQSADRGDAA